MNDFRDVLRDVAVDVAMAFLGKPYIWAGDDPINGFDCSGFVIEILKSNGVLPRRGDWTANALYEKFLADGCNSVKHPHNGCLAFYYNNSDERIIHVEYCLNEVLTIGASGGGSLVISDDDAADENAYVKIRPINYDRGTVVFLDPYETWSL